MITERERYREGRAPHIGGQWFHQCLRVTQELSNSQGVRERNTSCICLMELSGQLVTLSVRHLYPTIEYSLHTWTYNKAKSMPLCRLDNKMKVSSWKWSAERISFEVFRQYPRYFPWCPGSWAGNEESRTCFWHPETWWIQKHCNCPLPIHLG